MDGLWPVCDRHALSRAVVGRRLVLLSGGEDALEGGIACHVGQPT
jgi:hypothetical protein